MAIIVSVAQFVRTLGDVQPYYLISRLYLKNGSSTTYWLLFTVKKIFFFGLNFIFITFIDWP